MATIKREAVQRAMDGDGVDSTDEEVERLLSISNKLILYEAKKLGVARKIISAQHGIVQLRYHGKQVLIRQTRIPLSSGLLRCGARCPRAFAAPSLTRPPPPATSATTRAPRTSCWTTWASPRRAA